MQGKLPADDGFCFRPVLVVDSAAVVGRQEDTTAVGTLGHAVASSKKALANEGLYAAVVGMLLPLLPPEPLQIIGGQGYERPVAAVATAVTIPVFVDRERSDGKCHKLASLRQTGIWVNAMPFVIHVSPVACDRIVHQIPGFSGRRRPG